MDSGFRRVATALVVLVAMGVVSGVVDHSVATAQEESSRPQSYRGELDYVVAECDGFELRESLVERRNFRLVLDDEDQLVGDVTRVTSRGTIVNSDTDEEFRSRGNYVVTRDYETGEESWEGTLTSIRDSKDKEVIRDRGTIVFDADGEVVEEDGTFALTLSDDPDEVLCSALASR